MRTLVASSGQFRSFGIHRHSNKLEQKHLLHILFTLLLSCSLLACGGGGGGSGQSIPMGVPTNLGANSNGLQGLGPNSQDQLPNSDGYYPDANGKYPDKNGIYPDKNGVYPSPVQAGYFANENGVARSYSIAGPLDKNNPFFKSFGNGRSCATCHDPEAGFSITPKLAKRRFDSSQGLDPLFASNDGMNSPLARIGSLSEREAASSMLLNKGLFRIGLKVPSDAEFEVVAITDPYGYATSAELSLFRRPLPSANLKFLSHVMWDGRETIKLASSSDCIPNLGCFAPLDTNLGRQAQDATIGHAQAAQGLTEEERRLIVEFEKTLFTAQIYVDGAGFLDVAGANGGAEKLSKVAFTFGTNSLDFGNVKTGAIFDSIVMKNFTAWLNTTGTTSQTMHQNRQAIARGEVLFNTRTFHNRPSTGVRNDLSIPLTKVTCSSCHNTPQVGGSSAPLAVNIFTSDPENRTQDLPLYILRNKITGLKQASSDPGIAMQTGKWEDIGRFKVPNLRGLSTRAPYFHNGSAATILDVVQYYDTTFQLDLTSQEFNDLVAFLNAL